MAKAATKHKRVFTNQKGVMSALRNAPEKGHIDFKHSTAKGLKLRVYSTGRAVFVHRFSFNKRESFYRLPDIEVRKGGKDEEARANMALAEAMVVHSKQRAELAAGINPAIERALQAREIASMSTVEQFADAYIQLYAKEQKKSWGEDKRYLDADVIPVLGAMPLNKVKRLHINGLLDKKQQAGAMVVRNRLISLLSKFFNYAIERGHIDSNPVSGIKRTKEKSKERVLSDDEIRFLWHETDENSRFSLSTRLALRLILVTGQRPSEVAGMHESQMQDDVWTMQDTKNGRTHSVPLSPLAMQLIEEAQPHKHNGFLLPNTKGVAMSKTILPKAMSRLDWQDSPATPHDLRRTALTGISRLGFNRLVQDKIANHVDNSIGGIYDRHDYMEGKRRALEAWARRLNQIVTGQTESNVVQLRSA